MKLRLYCYLQFTITKVSATKSLTFFAKPIALLIFSLGFVPHWNKHMNLLIPVLLHVCYGLHITDIYSIHQCRKWHSYEQHYIMPCHSNTIILALQEWNQTESQWAFWEEKKALICQAINSSRINELLEHWQARCRYKQYSYCSFWNMILLQWNTQYYVLISSLLFTWIQSLVSTFCSNEKTQQNTTLTQLITHLHTHNRWTHMHTHESSVLITKPIAIINGVFTHDLTHSVLSLHVPVKWVEWEGHAERPCSFCRCKILA